MNIEAYTNLNSLYSALDANLSLLEKKWGKNDKEESPAIRLWGLILRAYEQTGRKVVVLVDEYDKPLISTIDDFMVLLKAFYASISYDLEDNKDKDEKYYQLICAG